jgi:hypothetical protein
MRLILVVGAFAFAFVGCGGGGGTGDQKAPDSGPQPCSTSGGCVKPATVSIRTKSGQESINMSDVTFLQVKVYKNTGPIGGVVDLRREFTGQDAVKVLTQFGLDTPLENAPQPSSSMTTGQLTFNYKRASDQTEQSKTLLIQNKQYILDYDYDDITYDPHKTFDRSWLEKQPE